jgi:hypothetical protein
MEFSILSALQVLAHIAVTSLRSPWFIAVSMSRHYLIAPTQLSFASPTRCIESHFDGDWGIRDLSSYLRMCQFLSNFDFFLNSFLPFVVPSLSLSLYIYIYIYIYIYDALFILYQFLRYFCFLPLCIISVQFLTAFEKLRRATISFVGSVSPSVSMKNWSPTGRIFAKFDIWAFLENLSRTFNFN